jgi:hypothetical protein
MHWAAESLGVHNVVDFFVKNYVGSSFRAQ